MNDLSSSSLTLTSLILLKNQIDHGKDYYDYLVPFIEQIYIEEPNEAFDVSEIKGFMDSDFGLIIPQEVVRLVVQRMKKKEYLKEEAYNFSIGRKFKGENLNPAKGLASREIDEVLIALQNYAKTLERDDLSKDRAMEAIQRFLSKFQIECISTYVQKTALPKLSSIDHWDEGLVGLFIQDVYENDFQLFKKFIVLVQGNMLANALISTDTKTPSNTLRKTTFYFDTPNVLNALGYSGEEKQKLANELIKLLKRLNGHIATFEHCVEEAKRILNSTANNIENPFFAQKPLNLVARQNEWLRSDLMTRAERLSSDIESLGFKIKPTPNFNERFQIDENALKKFLNKANVNSFEPQLGALAVDITSIRSIYCLRRDNRPDRLEDTNAILVTSNSGFVHASYEYAQIHDSHPRYNAAINNFTLTNLAWLKAPDFGSNLINAQGIALAYSAMRLSQEDLDNFLTKAETLSYQEKDNHDDLQILRSSPILQKELAIAKAGDQDLEDNKTISAVIKKVKAEYSVETDEAKTELRKERERHRKTQRDLRQLLEEKNRKIEQRAKRCDFIRTMSGDALILIVLIVVIGWLIHEFTPSGSWVNNLTQNFTFIVSVFFGLSLIWGVALSTGRCPPLLKTQFAKQLRVLCNNKVDDDA